MAIINDAPPTAEQLKLRTVMQIRGALAQAYTNLKNTSLHAHKLLWSHESLSSEEILLALGQDKDEALAILSAIDTALKELSQYAPDLSPKT